MRAFIERHASTYPASRVVQELGRRHAGVPDSFVDGRGAAIFARFATPLVRQGWHDEPGCGDCSIAATVTGVSE
jgi:hypothetical protein